MAKIFITGSTDGLGQLTAKALADQRHEVILHARNDQRAEVARNKVPGAAGVLTGDLSNIDETKELAHKVNALGNFDVIIHNAGVYQVPGNTILAVNTLAPFILTSLIHKPARMIYLSSGMHLQGRVNLQNFTTDVSRISYSDSKLHVLMLAKAVAAHWPKIVSNAVDPGWVPTRMGGQGAPDDLQKGYETQTWLAVSDDKDAIASGRYLYHKHETRYNEEADDINVRQSFIARCEEITGVAFDR